MQMVEVPPKKQKNKNMAKRKSTNNENRKSIYDVSPERFKKYVNAHIKLKRDFIDLKDTNEFLCSENKELREYVEDLKKEIDSYIEKVSIWQKIGFIINKYSFKSTK